MYNFTDGKGRISSKPAPYPGMVSIPVAWRNKSASTVMISLVGREKKLRKEPVKQRNEPEDEIAPDKPASPALCR